MQAKFILSKNKTLEQYNKLKTLGLKISYSYKTNREVGNILQELTDSHFSIHNLEEIDMIKNKQNISFFTQAHSQQELTETLKKGINNFVIDNEADLKTLLQTLKKADKKANISLRMKFQEHRIGTGKYFVYGMSAKRVNELLRQLNNNPHVAKLGIHIHRKSQNTSEWEIVEEMKDSIDYENLKIISTINLGGGMPVKYKTYTLEILPYIFEKLRTTVNFLKQYDIDIFIEPGRFIAAPAVKLQTQIIQVYENKIVINCSIYNCALDTTLTNIRMMLENELEDDEKGEYYLIKGNTPTRDDIFRYKVKLKNPKVGDTLIFLNAGAYNYTTDFCGLKKLKTQIVNEFA